MQFLEEINNNVANLLSSNYQEITQLFVPSLWSHEKVLIFDCKTELKNIYV